jgi:hypothetical protein
MSITHTLSLVALVAATTMLAAPLSAQAAARTPTPITLAIVDSMPVRTAKALLVRKPNGRTLLVLDRQHASPEILGAGLAAVQHFAKQPADGNERVVAIQGGVPGKPLSARRRAYLQRQLASVQARRTGLLGSLGQGRFMEFTDDATGR